MNGLKNLTYLSYLTYVKEIVPFKSLGFRWSCRNITEVSAE